MKDRPFEDAEKDIEFLSNEVFPVLDQDVKKEFINKIEKARSEGDSIGGELETMIINVPSCLGEPYFCSIESYLSQLIFSVGGVKGIAFGNYEDMISKTGSQVNDQLKFEDGKIVFKTNNAGGINGGISNGQNIYFTTIVKPTSSIAKTQNSINIKTKENIDLSISGRHDPCILHRVRPVIDSLVAYALVDLLMMNESKKI